MAQKNSDVLFRSKNSLKSEKEKETKVKEKAQNFFIAGREEFHQEADKLCIIVPNED